MLFSYVALCLDLKRGKSVCCPIRGCPVKSCDWFIVPRESETMREPASWMSLVDFETNAKDPPQDSTRGGVVDEEKFFAERLKIEVRRPEARASLGDVHAPSDEVAHELEAQW